MAYEVNRITPEDFAGMMGGGYYVTNYFETYTDRFIGTGFSLGMAGTYEFIFWSVDDGTLIGYEMQTLTMTLTVG